MTGLYRTFLFDADNTLFDYDRGEAEALAETLAWAGFSGGSGSQNQAAAGTALDVYRRLNAALWRRFETADITLAELKVQRFRSLSDALGLGADPEELSRQYLGRLATKAHLLPHAREVLAALARTAVLGLLTNGISDVQRGRLSRAGFGGLFSAVLISEEIGISKPDPRFFSRALAELGAGREESLCVGDSLSSDIQGARASGIAACWYNPSGVPLPDGAPEPDHVVRDLREVLPLAAGAAVR
jgi:2-haloacid dehalogenase